MFCAVRGGLPVVLPHRRPSFRGGELPCSPGSFGRWGAPVRRGPGWRPAPPEAAATADERLTQNGDARHRSAPYKGVARQRSAPYKGEARHRSAPYKGVARLRSAPYKGGARHRSAPYRRRGRAAVVVVVGRGPVPRLSFVFAVSAVRRSRDDLFAVMQRSTHVRDLKQSRSSAARAGRARRPPSRPSPRWDRTKSSPTAMLTPRTSTC
jgi:hypothetical protein